MSIPQDLAPTLDQFVYESVTGEPCDLDLILDETGRPVLFGVIRHNGFQQSDTFSGLGMEDVERLRDALTIVLDRAARYAGHAVSSAVTA